MRRDEIRIEVTRRILAIDRKLRADDVRDDASLVDNLGLDSLDLAELSVSIREAYDDLDLTDWYISSSSSGRDTIGSLVDFIDSRTEPLAAVKKGGA